MAEETWQKILNAVKKLILLKGLSHVTTKEIARETGISEGALYRHLKHKEKGNCSAMEEPSAGQQYDWMTVLYHERCESPGSVQHRSHRENKEQKLL